MKERIVFIDVMKGLTIILVVVGHYFLWVPFLPTAIWSFHMPLFVFINGFFYKKYSFDILLKKSLHSYIVPYIIVCILLLLIKIPIDLFKNNDILLGVHKSVIASVYGLASNSTLHRPEYVVKIGAVWFLRALFVSNIFMYLILLMKDRNKQWALTIFLLFLAIIQTSLFCTPFRINYGCSFLLWLLIGYNFGESYRKNDNFQKFCSSQRGLLLFIFIWLSVVILEIYSGSLYSLPSLRYPLYGLEIFASFCGIMIVMSFCKNIVKNSHKLTIALSYLGRLSLWILCIHAIDLEISNLFFHDTYKFYISLLRCVFDICLAVIIRELYIYLKTPKESSN